MINLRDKSLGNPFINLTYFTFACGDEIPLKLSKKSYILRPRLSEKTVFLDLRQKNALFDQNNVGRNQEKRVLKRF